MSKFANFIGSPFTKKKLILHCFSLLWAFRICLWILPFRWVNQKFGNNTGHHRNDRAEWAKVIEIAETIRACSKYVPAATCLTQAFAARSVLRHYGQHSEITIGVNNQAEAGFKAHAWISLYGKVIVGDHRDRERYVVLRPTDQNS